MFGCASTRGCRELLADLEDVNWKVDAHGNTYAELDKRDPKRTHVSDALGLLLRGRTQPDQKARRSPSARSILKIP